MVYVMDLDFSPLTDDQLIALIRAACAEAVNRGAACESAARDAYMSAAEAVRVARAAADREVERVRQEEEARVAKEAAAEVRATVEADRLKAAEEQQRLRWAKRKGVALAVKGLLADHCGFKIKAKDGSPMILELWQKGTDRRVFLGYGFSHGIVAYHVTGGGSGRYAKPPRTLENDRKDADVKKHAAKIAELCQAIHDLWPTGTTKIDLAEALAWNGDALPLPGYVEPPPPVKEPVLPATLRRPTSGAFTECRECAATTWDHTKPIEHKSTCVSRAQPPEAAAAPPLAPVVLPETLRYEERGGIPLVVCCSCGRFCAADMAVHHITHSTRCDTPAAQVPVGYAPPKPASSEETPAS